LVLPILLRMFVGQIKYPCLWLCDALLIHLVLEKNPIFYLRGRRGVGEIG
jgi:hypothetical protein